MKKPIVNLIWTVLAVVASLAPLSSRAQLLFQDSTNYPYTNGCIEGQGQWYCYSPTTPKLNVFVTNNVLLLTAVSTNDSVATPTNGWVNSTVYTYASFTINVSQLPSNTNGGYFCQFQNNNDTNDCCHLFIDTLGTSVPGTYRLGIANFSTSFTSLQLPNNYPLDLATNTPYNVVILFDSSQEQSDPLVGATLWINPSEQDFDDALAGEDVDGIGSYGNFAYGNDTTSSTKTLDLVISQIGFSPYIYAGISNVMAGASFDAVNSTNLPVFGVQPQSCTSYSGNSITLYAVASGVDVTYQWYSQNLGQLQDDGVNIIGSSSNTLVINNFQATDTYWDVATDAYGNTVTSSNAVNTVITTPTAPFFTEAPLNLTNNLFGSVEITDVAEGTGPLYYQWYFAPANTPNVFTQYVGQTSSELNLALSDYTYAGQYFVVASNSFNGGSVAVGPTNTLTELAPLVATMLQLHNFLLATTNQYLASLGASGTSYYINTNNVIASGYVVDYGASGNGMSFGGYGSTYSEFFIQDASGYGTEVYLGGLGNTNAPAVGTYVTVTGSLEVYAGTLEMNPANQAAVVIGSAPHLALTPKLFNAAFYDVTTNLLGTNVIFTVPSLVTLTNVYIYGTKFGGSVTNYTVTINGTKEEGIFSSNSTTTVYCTIGQYSTNAPVNTNFWEIYVPTYNYGPKTTPWAINTSAYQPIPTNCYQLTGVYENYYGTPELLVARYEDFVTIPPSTFAASVAVTNIVSGKQSLPAANVSWSAQPGSTYTVYSSTNLLAGWTPSAYGLTYYPTNGTFVDTNAVKTKFYRISTP